MHSDRFFHPWHSISIGTHVPESVPAIIEIQQGSKAKYELDKTTGFLRLDRVLATNLSYPAHYGFIPQTYCEDNDPLDVLIICSERLLPLSIVEVTIVGAMKMIDGGEQDDKLIAVATHDPLMANKRQLSDINAEILETIKHFFEHYKQRENKKVVIEAFVEKEAAQKILTSSINLYQQKKDSLR
jgi:inorganic pyrophosphatase